MKNIDVTEKYRKSLAYLEYEALYCVAQLGRGMPMAIIPNQILDDVKYRLN